MRPYYQDEFVTLYHGRWEDVLPTLPDRSFDAVITDPPYGYNIDKVTPWDRPVDVMAFTAEVKRLAREFYAVFGQMPHMAPWHAAADEAGLHFCEHIVWVKRICTPSHRLTRGHESILTYAVGERRQFYETSGPYEDVKVPGVLVDVVSLECIQRYLADLHCKLQGRDTRRPRGASGTNRIEKFPAGHLSDRSPRFANYTNVWSFLPPNQARRRGLYRHPTEKPVPIMDRLVRMLTDSGGVVLDPFAGSGTTLVAARMSGRRAVGVEMHEEFCEIAAERLQQAVMPLSEREEESDDALSMRRLFRQSTAIPAL